MTTESLDHEFPSLQERCLLYLITHVEDYSPQTLALLPRHLRRALLSSVAPLHLYQLDRTAVASGIDTEALWKDSGLSNLPSLSITSTDSRESYVNTVLLNITYELYGMRRKLRNEIFRSLNIEISMFGLFHSRLSTAMIHYLQHNGDGFVNVKDRHCFINIDIVSYKEFVKQHCQCDDCYNIMDSDHNCIHTYDRLCDFMSQNICSCSCVVRKEEIKSLTTTKLVPALARAGASPTHVMINTAAVVGLGLWMPENGGPLQPFLNGSKVKRITMCCNTKHTPSNTTSSILNTVLACPKPCLEHLEFQTSVSGDVLASIAPVLCAYGGLKTLEVDIDDSVRSLHHIISQQKELECLELCDTRYYSTVIDYKELFQSLCILFENNSFNRLHMRGFSLPLEDVQAIVAAFFRSTPTSEISTLKFSSTTIQEGKLLSSIHIDIFQEHSEKFGPRKHLILDAKESACTPESFWKWFESIAHIRLATLCGRCECHVSNVRQHFKDHQNFEVEITSAE